MTRLPLAPLTALVLTLALAPAVAVAAPPDAIRTGGPSAPADSKIALVGSGASLVGQAFQVVDQSGEVVHRGTLAKAAGTPTPWRFAATADLTEVSDAGSYRVKVGKLTSRTWVVKAAATTVPLRVILKFFAANSDGQERSPEHGPAHLNDAVIASGPHKGKKIDVTGGWMDAGDMLKFTTTTAYAAAALQAAARLDPSNASALAKAADVGVRWLVKAHPEPGLFIAQVGDERDHDRGFENPSGDDRSSRPGIGKRLAYPNMGADLGGKTAAALALAADRAAPGPARDALVQQARDWYAAGVASHKIAPKLPSSVGDFYISDTWEDALAAGAAALYRTTGERAFLADALRYMDEIDTEGRLGWNALAGFAAADLCGVLGAPAAADADARDQACERLGEDGAAAAGRARQAAFGTPGILNWGTTAENGGSGALAALAGRAGVLKGGQAIGAGARDWLLGRNAWEASFVAGFGPRAPRGIHHWASRRGKGRPVGSVVGGPAPLEQITGQQPDIGTFKRGRFDSKLVAYEDRRENYVTSEPAIDYAAGSILLLAAMR